MSFFKYHNYNNSEAIINNSCKSSVNEYFIHIGNQNGSGLVNVLDEYGNRVWSKIYTTDATIEFRKVMSFQDGYIILGVENGDSPFLLRMTKDGDILWHRTFQETPVKDNIYMANFYDRYLHFAFHNVKSNESGVMFITDKGESMFHQIILNSQGKREFKITGLATYGEMIHLSGVEMVKNREQGVFLTTQVGFGSINAKFTYWYDDTPVVLDGVYCREADGTVLISGVANDIPCFLKANEGYGASYQQFRGKRTRYALGYESFYAYNDQNEIIYSNYDYMHDWVKKINVEKLTINQVPNNSPLFHGFNESTNYSGYVSSDFNTCKTVPQNHFRPSLIEFQAIPVNYGLEEKYFDYHELSFDIHDLPYEFSDVCEVGNVINFNDFSGLQTPNFYLQAAGSKGEDSTKGIHLRWSLGGELGENHLPKGNLAANNINYNKPNDFVKVYRAPYTKYIFNLSFNTAPQLVDDSQKLWVYKFNNDKRIFYVYFKNKQVYNAVRQNINPLAEPLKFIQSYGNEIIEVQCKTDLFFAAEAKVENLNSQSVLELEGLSVGNVSNTSQQSLAYRKQNYGYDVDKNYFNAENGKTIRFRAGNSYVSSIDFEFYSDFIIVRNEEQSWKHIGNFALTTETGIAHKRLDPLPDSNPVHGAWLRYNDEAYVNTENYVKKWNHNPTGPLDRDIQTVVENYLSLSNAQPNPKAYETINFNFAPTNSDPFVNISTDPVQDGATQVSNLDILNIASLDYHVARMLGLGHLDIKNDAFDQEFIYIAEYFTNKDLDINTSDKSFQLLSMSLPVSTEIERLSLPVDLMKLSKGMEPASQNSSNLYNSEGYSHDGKYRYISLYNAPVPENELNPTFFSSYMAYDASQFTTPVYAGLEHRLIESGQTDNYVWKKPELCHDTQYFNLDLSVNSQSEKQETLPIQIPDSNTPLYMHKQDKTGTYFYKGYGINWFSRAQHGPNELSIVTDIKPFNKLLPPSGATAFNIQKEFPLTFTTQEEQGRLKAIAGTDKTLARLTFDYHIYQDQVGYSIPFDSVISNTEYISDPNSLFPDNKEVFADEVEIFYRNYTPKIISARAYDVIQHPTNQLLAIIKTQDLPLVSTGANPSPNANPNTNPNPNQNQQNSGTPTVLYSEFPAGTTASDFIGGIFLMDSDSYIIHEIIQESSGLTFTVFKKAASDAIIAGTTPLINQSSLTLPIINPGTEGLFNVTENMQNTSTWGVKNPNSLKVQIGSSDWTVNREVISMPQSNGVPQRYLEKSRGIWKKAKVEKFYEPIHKYQNSQGTVIEYDSVAHPHVFQGVYKITFPGFKMAQHPQVSSNSHSVEWFNGIVRLFTIENYGWGRPTDSRSIFKVVKTENIGLNADLVVYVYDENFIIEENSSFEPMLEVYDPNSFQVARPTDPVIGPNIDVNYYPSYKVYLHKNEPSGFTENVVLPPTGEDVRYSIFGFKSVDNHNSNSQGNKYKSKFSVPTVMFAQRIIQPEQPKKPTGSKYATRPDKFGKSTYSILTKYIHKPYSVQFFRANNSLLLASLYEPETILEIKTALNELGGNEEEYFNDRWTNFVDFEFILNSPEFLGFPLTSETPYALPLPDSAHLFNVINEFIDEHNSYYELSPSNLNYSQPLTIADRGNIKFNDPVIKAIPSVSGPLNFGSFIKERLSNCFLPLTEVPVIYQHIKPLNVSTVTGHRPKNKKQNIRDTNGYLLPPTHADFDMAPMAAIYSTTPEHSTLFTDFTLDGASDNFYFYGVRELGNQMQMGEFSEFAGPIKLVNTNPAEAPKIMSLLPVVDNATLGITAKVKVEVNPYPEVEQITKVSLYRATNKLDADSILSMDHIKTVDIADVQTDEGNGTWVLYDEFEDLEDKPYGDLLFYRIVVTRKVEYSTTDYEVSPPATKVVVEEAPSMPSKVVVSTLVENYNPPTPELNYHSEPVAVDSDIINWVILSWDQVCYKGKYQLYKLSNQGNWKEIAKINTDTKDSSKAHLSLLESNPSTNTEEWIVQETFDLTANKFYLPLEKVNLDPMLIKDAEGNILYHHFKLVAQNTSNMFSTQEKILTIYKKETWSDIGGISSDGIDGMITQGTFIIRP
ncbi:hypothetical protein [Chryseobacterium sp.]|uniref:hypothetical protein n=1 Tax=Chryseobacterium sp. TaxID=1871047 RepID=UPI002FC815A5